MNNSKLLANRFKEVLLNGEWIANTNYTKVLSDVNWQQATKKVSTLNTIALLTFHINYYIKGVSVVFEGKPLSISDKFSFDAPALNSEEDWQNLIKELNLNANKFANFVEQLSTEQLDQVFEKEIYGTYRRNIEGMIEHCYYHLGQISLIKKMVLSA